MAEYEENVLRRYPAASLENDEVFCKAAGELQGEFLVIHPFREGNARTIKLATDVLAVQSARPLLIYDDSDIGREVYTAAAKAAFRRRYQPMAAIIREALERARKEP